jgi:hypothetical protein
MLRQFAEILGFKRIFIRLPIYNPGIYAYLVSLITPVAHSITLCLFESAASTVICEARSTTC